MREQLGNLLYLSQPIYFYSVEFIILAIALAVMTRVKANAYSNSLICVVMAVVFCIALVTVLVRLGRGISNHVW